jgi:hypothetical protein
MIPWFQIQIKPLNREGEHIPVKATAKAHHIPEDLPGSQLGSDVIVHHT